MKIRELGDLEKKQLTVNICSLNVDRSMEKVRTLQELLEKAEEELGENKLSLSKAEATLKESKDYKRDNSQKIFK